MAQRTKDHDAVTDLKIESGVRRSPRGSGLSVLLDELERMTDALAARMLQRYLDTIPSYRAMPDATLRQVREVNRANITGFIAALRAGTGPSAEDLTVIRASASRRAREGVPLSALLAAYRLGAQMAWEEARRIIGDDRSLLPAGLEFATAVMHWIDEASGAAAQAYLAEYERITTDREASRRDFLDGLLSGSLTADEVVARAEALGMDPAGAYAAAVVAPVGAPDDPVLRTAQHRLRAMTEDSSVAPNSFLCARGNELVLIFSADGEGTAGVVQMLGAFAEDAAKTLESRFCAGIGRAREALPELAGSYREALIALTAARAGTSAPVAVYGEVLIEELLLRERSVARRLAQTILDPLDAHPDLRATLVEYLENGPSLPAVAKRLYLHPNTVAYRLQRVRELTGRDPKTPAGVAQLYLAMRAAQLVTDDQPS